LEGDYTGLGGSNLNENMGSTLFYNLHEVEEFSSFHFDNIKVNLAIDCAIKERDRVIIYDWKTGKSIPEDLPIQLTCYALYAMEKWQIPPESLNIIEYNLSFNKKSWFSVTKGQIEYIKGYIR